jgi:hypothetical protein
MTRLFNHFVALALIALTSFSVGCASIVKGTTQAIPVSSNPNGADVTLDGNKVGQTPVSVEVKRKSDHLMTISKPGYESENIAITRNLGGAVFGNILAGGLVGWGVDAVSGAQYNLTPATISVTLYKSNEVTEEIRGTRNDAVAFIGELKKLDELHASKSITDEEYVKMRTSLVNRYSGEGSGEPSPAPLQPSTNPPPANP